MNIYEIITGKIIECLNQGVVPWQRDWLSVPFSNYCTKKAYQGINQLLLVAQNILNKKNYSNPYWLTWKQVNKSGGLIRKGEKASIIIYYDTKIIEVETENGNGEKEITKKKISFVRYYSVFNQEQTTGIPEIQFNKNEYKKNCEDIINNLKEKPEVRYGANPAYNPIQDFIIMPAIKYFKSSESYYSALYHELIHYVGHDTRLNRFNSKSLKFASSDYSKEELIAELGSSFLCHLTGIEKEIIKNQASYIKDWLEVLNNDKKLIVTASSQAQKSVDYILSACNSSVNQKTDIEPLRKAS